MIARLRNLPLKRIALGAASLGIIAATFAYFLPTIADYGDVWGVVKDLSWKWIAALFASAAINIVTFAPPWQVALPGLSFGRALMVTQASTARFLSPSAAPGAIGTVPQNPTLT